MRIGTMFRLGAAGLALTGAVAPAVAGADGLERNRAALAPPDRPCTPQADRAPALRRQCAMSKDSRALQDDGTTGGSNIGPYVVGGFWAGTIGGGLAVILSDDDDDNDGEPISS